MLAMDNNKVSLLVANVLNGPDAILNTAWAGAIANTTQSGKRIIGYVRTGYLGVSQQQFKTRLGSGRLSDWAAQIEQDVDMWYKLYPGIGGIFFDEGWNSCGVDGDPSSNIYADLYNYINWNTKRKYPGAYTVLNPGDFMPRCFENSSDTLLTFESSYERYIDESIYKPNGWTARDMRKNWHIVYQVPQDQLTTVAALALKRGAGLIELLNTVMPNPYDHLPDATYMQTEMDAITGSQLRIESPPSPFHNGNGGTGSVGGLSIDSSDYTSVSLSWTGSAAQFQVNVVGVSSYYFPGTMNKATIGGLDSAKSYTFVVYALDTDGTTLASSNQQTVTTTALPGGAKTVANLKVTPSAGSTTYQADILVPYAFIRIYIWDSEVECEWELPGGPGWPVNFAVANYVCTHYMVEGETLYAYNGQVSSGTQNAPWAWKSLGSVTIQQTGYTWTWTVPIGTSTTDTSKFVIQVQGYGPAGNVFKPCPSFGGGPQDAYGYCS
jgi:hypothetical protein